MSPEIIRSAQKNQLHTIHSCFEDTGKLDSFIKGHAGTDAPLVGVTNDRHYQNHGDTGVLSENDDDNVQYLVYENMNQA